MKVSVLVKPSSRKESVKSRPDGTLCICVNAPARQGKANERVIELLSEHFNIPKSSVRLVVGAHAKRKVFEVIRNQ